jgi:hypothetical protein
VLAEPALADVVLSDGVGLPLSDGDDEVGEELGLLVDPAGLDELIGAAGDGDPGL